MPPRLLTPADRPLGVATSTRYLPELEGLRGMAMLLVYAFHLDGLVGWELRRGHHLVDPLSAFVRAGDAGVNLFFVLSSCLLAMPFLQADTTLPARRYFAKRALRILPLYYAAVVVATLALARSWTELGAAIPYLLFLNALPSVAVPLRPFSNVWWSLATEWQFYVVLPLAALLLRRAGWRLAAAVALAWAMVYAAWIAGGFEVAVADGQLLLGMSLFGRAPYFAGGALIAWLFVRGGERVAAWLARMRLDTPAGADVAVAIVMLLLSGLLVGVAWAGSFAVQVAPWHAHHVIEAMLWTALVGLVLLTPTRLRAALRLPLLIQLGVLSYSVYIVHAPILAVINTLRRAGVADLVGWNWRTVLLAAVLTVATGLVASLTYRFIESPFLSRKERA
ncbi:MAG: acyltransferase [Deltaproteobacteria bacterium]|nr:acyltransferase [Deltaproteobacteria bacterium]